MSQSSWTGNSAISGVTRIEHPTVVFVHGFLDDARIWDDVVTGLPWATVTVELGDVPVGLDAFAEHVAAIVDNDVNGDVVLVGQSMGCQVAELATLLRPERITGLVLITPVPLQGVSLPEEIADTLRGCGGQQELQLGIRTQFGTHLPHDKIPQLLDSGMRPTPEQVAATFDAWSSGHSEGAAPTRVIAPIQLIVSDSDPVVSGPLLEDLILPRFPGAAIVTIASSGHWPHVEQPSQVVEAISRFVTATHSLNPPTPTETP
jgi:pimeloyl-ACP methyl ester carboxylesterase